MIGEVIKIQDFKNEKHVPTQIIESEANEEFEVEIQVGKEQSIQILLNITLYG